MSVFEKYLSFFFVMCILMVAYSIKVFPWRFYFRNAKKVIFTFFSDQIFAMKFAMKSIDLHTRSWARRLFITKPLMVFNNVKKYDYRSSFHVLVVFLSYLLVGILIIIMILELWVINLKVSWFILIASILLSPILFFWDCKSPKYFYWSMLLVGQVLLIILANLFEGSFLNYLITINILTFFVFGGDKYRAIQDRDLFRIPENFLHVLALAGGQIGYYTGMLVFHHKIKKKIFYFIPALTMFAYGIFLSLLQKS